MYRYCILCVFISQSVYLLISLVWLRSRFVWPFTLHTWAWICMSTLAVQHTCTYRTCMWMYETIVSVCQCHRAAIFISEFSFAHISLLGRALGSYVDSQWGLALFSVPNESPCVCAFLGDRKTVVGKPQCLQHCVVCMHVHMECCFSCSNP